MNKLFVWLGSSVFYLSRDLISSKIWWIQFKTQAMEKRSSVEQALLARFMCQKNWLPTGVYVVACLFEIEHWLSVALTYKTTTFFCKIIIFMLKRNNKALINTENYIKILRSIRNKNQPNRVLKDGCLVNLISKNFNIQIIS